VKRRDTEPTRITKMKIAAAGNVEVPAYLVIVAKGYDVSREKIANSVDDVWIARKKEKLLQRQWSD
jgi:hypothetical protein